MKMITTILELAKENDVSIDIKFNKDGTTIAVYINGSGLVSCEQVKVYELQTPLTDVVKQAIESHKSSEGWDILKALKIASEIDPIVIRPWEWFK